MIAALIIGAVFAGFLADDILREINAWARGWR